MSPILLFKRYKDFSDDCGISPEYNPSFLEDPLDVCALSNWLELSQVPLHR